MRAGAFTAYLKEGEKSQNAECRLVAAKSVPILEISTPTCARPRSCAGSFMQSAGEPLRTILEFLETESPFATQVQTFWRLVAMSRVRWNRAIHEGFSGVGRLVGSESATESRIRHDPVGPSQKRGQHDQP
jgi:hypothetical protein